MLEEEDLKGDPAQLARFDAIVLGVRAFQYQRVSQILQPSFSGTPKTGAWWWCSTRLAAPWVTEQIGPYPLSSAATGYGRRCSVTFYNPGIRCLTARTRLLKRILRAGCRNGAFILPRNGIPECTTVLSSTDPGEKTAEGGCHRPATAKANLSTRATPFFRQLPAGVPGAYRLFANLLAK